MRRSRQPSTVNEPGRSTLSLLRIWIIGSLTLFGGWFVYEYVPLLIPLAVVAIVLGCLVAGIVSLTRLWRQPGPGDTP